MKRMLLGLSFVLVAAVAVAEEPSDFSYDSHGKRDPFWPLVTANGTILNFDKEMDPADIMIQGIIDDSGEKGAAIINDQIVQKGDMVGLYEIVEISSDGVVLKKGEEQITVTMTKEK